MALNKASLKAKIIVNLQAAGFGSNEFSQFEVLAEAIASAVVDEIQANAEVVQAVKVQ